VLILRKIHFIFIIIMFGTIRSPFFPNFPNFRTANISTAEGLIYRGYCIVTYQLSKSIIAFIRLTPYTHQNETAGMKKVGHAYCQLLNENSELFFEIKLADVIFLNVTSNIEYYFIRHIAVAYRKVILHSNPNTRLIAYWLHLIGFTNCNIIIILHN